MSVTQSLSLSKRRVIVPLLYNLLPILSIYTLVKLASLSPCGFRLRFMNATARGSSASELAGHSVGRSHRGSMRMDQHHQPQRPSIPRQRTSSIRGSIHHQRDRSLSMTRRLSLLTTSYPTTPGVTVVAPPPNPPSKLDDPYSLIDEPRFKPSAKSGTAQGTRGGRKTVAEDDFGFDKDELEYLRNAQLTGQALNLFDWVLQQKVDKRLDTWDESMAIMHSCFYGSEMEEELQRATEAGGAAGGGGGGGAGTATATKRRRRLSILASRRRSSEGMGKMVTNISSLNSTVSGTALHGTQGEERVLLKPSLHVTINREMEELDATDMAKMRDAYLQYKLKKNTERIGVFLRRRQAMWEHEVYSAACVSCAATPALPNATGSSFSASSFANRSPSPLGGSPRPAGGASHRLASTSRGQLGRDRMSAASPTLPDCLPEFPFMGGLIAGQLPSLKSLSDLIQLMIASPSSTCEMLERCLTEVQTGTSGSTSGRATAAAEE